MDINKQIFKASLFQKEYNLEKLLKEKYNNIQNQIQVIYVVGTNGKGSVSSYLQKQLMCHHGKVGLFISPAFFQYNETIKINQDYISDSDIKKVLKEIKNDIKTYDLTFFEI
jgi:dihydrofolate synthase/folylpolyglutamate synthase